ncbi:unnamed protein product [Psylliodes chrysocephalus]|uniref:Optineurin n=1 Tax=Psylliodes chrysocephalus TaxID=3402493 RepID=A0A9P0CX90_9CUCU|nr:unnamed protein product [Psylliodes chrysocephala]
MAATNLVFKMPLEPHPLPSLEDDEESFVVLGQSMPDSNVDEYMSTPVDISVIAEAKRLIDSELDALNSMNNKPDEKKETTDANKDIPTQELPKMDTSTNLPSMPNIEKGFETTNAISIASFSSDMSSEEVQNKISQIIDENIRLKDTILQNNMSLKSQYEKILAWQEDVQRVHQIHKEKLSDAKQFIDKLKMEKENLKRDLTKATEVNTNLEAEIVELKRSLKEQATAKNEVLLQRSDDNIKEFQLDVANKKIKDLEAAAEKLLAENKMYASNMAKIKEDTKKEMDDMRNQLEKLALNENQVKLKIETLNPELEKLTEERDYAIGKIEELQQKLEAKLKREEALLMTTNTLKAQLELGNHSEEIDNLRTQLGETQTALTQIEFSRKQAYSQVYQLTEELTRLKSTENCSDEICALKVQLDVYKTDFEEERHAREVIKEEKDKIEEDIQNLQRRNQQLQEEIEMLRGERDYVVYPSRSAPRDRVQDQRTTASSSSNAFKCPKCDFGFNDVNMLQNHVYRCIELDDRLP